MVGTYRLVTLDRKDELVYLPETFKSHRKAQRRAKMIRENFASMVELLGVLYLVDEDGELHEFTQVPEFIVEGADGTI